MGALGYGAITSLGQSRASAGGLRHAGCPWCRAAQGGGGLGSNCQRKRKRLLYNRHYGYWSNNCGVNKRESEFAPRRSTSPPPSAPMNDNLIETASGALAQTPAPTTLLSPTTPAGGGYYATPPRITQAVLDFEHYRRILQSPMKTSYHYPR